MILTRHSIERIRERVGLPPRAIKRNAEVALEKGVTHKECTGGLKRYIDYLFLQEKNATNIRIYSDFVYLFTNDYKLLTVMMLPIDYREVVHKIIKKRDSTNKEV